MGQKSSKAQTTPKRRSVSFNVKREPAFGITQVPGRKSAQDKLISTNVERLLREQPNLNIQYSPQPAIKRKPSKTLQQIPSGDKIEDSQSTDKKPKSLETLEPASSSPPSFVYYIDEATHALCILDSKSNTWKKNMLKNAHCTHPTYSLSSFGMSVLRDEILASLHSSAIIPVDNDTIHIVGRFHLEYKITVNSFKILGENSLKFSNPTVCYGDKKIYFLSGEKGDGYINACVEYNVETKSWISLPDLPAPHVNGSAVYLQDSKNPNNFKLAVIGGFSSKQTDQMNQNISIFDFDEYKWETIPLSESPSETPLPTFIRAPFIQEDDETLLILDSEGIFYEIDVEKQKLQRAYGLYAVRDMNKKRIISYQKTESNHLLMATKERKVVINLQFLATETEDLAAPSSPQRKKPSSDYSDIKVDLNRKKFNNVL